MTVVLIFPAFILVTLLWPGLQECPARSPHKWQPEMGLDPIYLGLYPTLAFGTGT